MMSNTTTTKKKNGGWGGNFSIIFSIIALILSSLTFIWTFFWPGELIIHKPTGFCITRGFQDLEFMSDYLIIPVVVENTGHGVKIIEQPTLLLKEKNNQHKPVTYHLAGFVPDLYFNKLSKNYEPGFDVTVPGKSIKSHLLVFQIENWWDKSKPEYYKFQFKGGRNWEVHFGYIYDSNEVLWHDSAKNYTFFSMPIYDTINNLVKDANYDCDCFSFGQKEVEQKLKQQFTNDPQP